MLVETTNKNWDDIIDNNIAICSTAVLNENIFKRFIPIHSTVIFESLLRYSKFLRSEGHSENQIPNCTPVLYFEYLLGVPV